VHVLRPWLRRSLALALGALSSMLPIIARAGRGFGAARRDRDALWDDLGRAPYATSGSGRLVVSMLSFSTCPSCIAFMKTVDAPRRANFELREIFVPMSGPMLEAQAVGIDMTRDPAIGAAAMLRRANGGRRRRWLAERRRS